MSSRAAASQLSMCGSSPAMRRSMRPPTGGDKRWRQGMNDSATLSGAALRVPQGTDLVEWYFEQGWTDGLPVVPPTAATVAAVVAALGGAPGLVECKGAPGQGSRAP